MKLIENSTTENILKECARPAIANDQIYPLIDEIFEQVLKRGDEALKKYTAMFDGIDIERFATPPAELKDAASQVSEELKAAIQVAAKNIERFHKAQETKLDKIETSPGVWCWQEPRPIEKVGIYIPGGTAPLFSTVLMLAIPAKIAACKEIVLCTPPDASGKINPAILYAAHLTGVTAVYKLGGAQAIAALTYGTASIPKVNKIFGPGNQYVTCAKTRAQQFGVAIDMPAGPSELMVVADETANPEFIASDLLSQAEHGSDSQVICLLKNDQIKDKVLSEVDKQLKLLPRQEMAANALANSKLIVASSEEQLIEVMNGYGPEHLIVCTSDNQKILDQIINAGSVFIGAYTPESAGDYASGTNHTLPTAGFAKAYSGVNLDAFVKKITFQKISKEGIQLLGPSIELMAEAEKLDAHKRAVSVRLKSLNNE